MTSSSCTALSPLKTTRSPGVAAIGWRTTMSPTAQDQPVRAGRNHPERELAPHARQQVREQLLHRHRVSAFGEARLEARAATARLGRGLARRAGAIAHRPRLLYRPAGSVRGRTGL